MEVPEIVFVAQRLPFQMESMLSPGAYVSLMCEEDGLVMLVHDIQYGKIKITYNALAIIREVSSLIFNSGGADSDC